MKKGILIGILAVLAIAVGSTKAEAGFADRFLVTHSTYVDVDSATGIIVIAAPTYLVGVSVSSPVVGSLFEIWDSSSIHNFGSSKGKFDGSSVMFWPLRIALGTGLAYTSTGLPRFHLHFERK